MTGLDCNILVQLALADHPANVATVIAIQTEAQQGHQLVLPSLIVTEFLHVITDERRFSPPLTMIEATAWIEDFLANPLNAFGESTDQPHRRFDRSVLDQEAQLTKLIDILRSRSIRLCVISFANPPFPSIQNYVKESGGICLYPKGVPTDKITSQLKNTAMAQ